MRKPTYRIWDRRKKIMWQPENVATLDFESECAWIKQPYKGGHWVYFKDANLMESTGLKDKQGKDIYENDIVKVNCGTYFLFEEIIFAHGAFRFKNLDTLPIGEHMEIVGNTYVKPIKV